MTLTFLFTTFLFILPASLFLLALAFVIFIRGSHGSKCLSSLGFGHAGGEILAAQIPEVGAARQLWAANSRPLDPFEMRPFAQVLAKDRRWQRNRGPSPLWQC